MKVKCTDFHSIIDGEGPSDLPFLTEGKEYVVLRIDDTDVLILNDMGYPSDYSIRRFQVVDPKIPQDWCASYDIYDDDISVTIGPKGFTEPKGFIEDYVCELEPASCEKFLKYLAMIGVDMPNSVEINGVEYLTIAGEMKKRKNQED